MPDSSSRKPPFKCGKCGASGQYRDDDPINKVSHIVCPICGNRWPGGPTPVMIETITKPEGENRVPSKKGTCVNCCRPDLSIVGRGLCGTCYGVRVGRTGEALEKALADAKIKLQADYQEALRKKAKEQPVDEPLPKTEDNIPETIPQTNEENTEASGFSPKNEESITEENTRSISVRFFPEDDSLYQYLIAGAKKKRRTVEAHLLYLIECNYQADLEQWSSPLPNHVSADLK